MRKTRPRTYLPKYVHAHTTSIGKQATHSPSPMVCGVRAGTIFNLRPHMQVLVLHVIDDGWTVRVRLARDMIALTVPRDR